MVTRDLADYHVPVHLDVPEIEIIAIDEVDPIVNTVGAKGIGEIGITGAAAAIANAVYHATGVSGAGDLPIHYAQTSCWCESGSLLPSAGEVRRGQALRELTPAPHPQGCRPSSNSPRTGRGPS